MSLAAIHKVARPGFEVYYRVHGACAPIVRETLADLEAIREQMGIERWAVAGHSAGAMLALVYATQFRERVVSLVLMNSGPVPGGAWIPLLK